MCIVGTIWPSRYLWSLAMFTSSLVAEKTWSFSEPGQAKEHSTSGQPCSLVLSEGQPCPLVLSEVRGTTQCEECDEARAGPPFQRDSLHYRPPGRRQTCEPTEALPLACNGAVHLGATRPQPLRGPLPGIAQGGPGVPASVERAPRKRGGLPCGPHVAIPWPQVASLGAPLVAVPRGSLRVVVPRGAPRIVLRADPAGSVPRGGVGRNGGAVSAHVLRGHQISLRPSHEVTQDGGLHGPQTH